MFKVVGFLCFSVATYHDLFKSVKSWLCVGDGEVKLTPDVSFPVEQQCGSQSEKLYWFSDYTSLT